MVRTKNAYSKLVYFRPKNAVLAFTNQHEETQPIPLYHSYSGMPVLFKICT